MKLIKGRSYIYSDRRQQVILEFVNKNENEYFFAVTETLYKNPNNPPEVLFGKYVMSVGRPVVLYNINNVYDLDDFNLDLWTLTN